MGTSTLTKVLQFREKEKNDAQKAYQQSMESFEKVATHLYQLLKKKEDAEDTYEASLKELTPIETIRQQMDYIEMLSRQIVNLQQDVQKARESMEYKHERLQIAHTEVKKFENIIEKRQQTKEELRKKQEAVEMDEISIQQYLSQIR